VLLYGVQVLFVRVDAHYFTSAFLGFIHDVLQASPVVDYNWRPGKRFLATLFFLRQWKEAMRPRSNIERHFAFLKRYWGLADFQVQGWVAVSRYAWRVHLALLLVALAATLLGRPDLTTSRSRVLAFVTDCMKGSRFSGKAARKQPRRANGNDRSYCSRIVGDRTTCNASTSHPYPH